MKSDILITGMSCFSSLGQGLHLLLNNKKIPNLIDSNVVDECIKNIDTGPYKLYRVEKNLLAVIIQALQSANIDIKNGCRIALLTGITYAAEDFKSDFFNVYTSSSPDFTSPVLFPYTAENSLSANISILLGLNNINLTFACGITSCSEAIITASDILNEDKSDVVVVCGENFFSKILEEKIYIEGYKQECAGALVLQKNSITNNVTYDKILYSKRGCIGDIFNDLQYENTDCIIINNGKKNDFLFDHIKKIIFLEDILGNTFSASACLGIILGCIKTSIENFIFINIDDSGKYILIKVGKKS